MSQRQSVAVVGAGISGLTAAYHLKKSGVDVQVFEAEDRIGGRVSSLQIDDFVINRGADIIPSGYTATIGLYQELGLIGPQPQTIDSVIGFYREGAVHRFRSSRLLRDGLTTKLLSWRSKLKLGRLAIDGWRAHRILKQGDFSKAVHLDTETAINYAQRRLNDEIRRYLIQPIVHGISHDASILDFFFSATLTIGSGFLQYPGGLGVLTQSLANHVSVSTSTTVDRVRKAGNGVCVEWQNKAKRFDAALIAVPGEQVASIAPDLPSRMKQLLTEDLCYSPLYLAHFGLSDIPDEPCGIVFVDADDSNGLVSISLEHNLRTSAAPEGKGLLTVLFSPAWTQQHAIKNDAELLDMMQQQIERVMPGVRGNITMRHLDRWQHGAQRAWPGYCAQVSELRSLMDPNDPIQLTGDFFGSSSTNACVLEAQRAARTIMHQLQSQR